MSDRHETQNERTGTGSRADGHWHVQLPDRVVSKIAGRIQRTEFESVDEYVTFAMESLLRELDEQDDSAEDHRGHGDDAENTDELEERLESLGYM